MIDVKNLFQDAIEELAADENDPKNKAIREIIQVERNNYYSGKGSANRLRDIREIVSKYAAEGESDSVN